MSVEPEILGMKEVNFNEFEAVYGYAGDVFKTAIAAARVIALGQAIEACRGVLRDEASTLSYDDCDAIQQAIHRLMGTGRNSNG